MGRRAVVGAIAAGGALILTGCQSAPTRPTQSRPPTPTPEPSTPPLTEPGRARAAIAELRSASGDGPVIKVDVTANQCVLTTLDGNKPAAWVWKGGEVSSDEPSVEPVAQTAFDPDQFALDDVGALFATAAEVSGSAEAQLLQVVEYNQGQVLMTVTTSPESQTVFFRPNGTMVDELDFTQASDMAEALDDAVAGAHLVIAIGYKPNNGLWVDVPGDEGVIVRRTRQARVPMWSASRREGYEVALFDPALVQPAVLAELLVRLPDAAHTKRGDAEFTIDTRDKLSDPTIHADAGDGVVVMDLDGADITDRIGG